LSSRNSPTLDEYASITKTFGYAAPASDEQVRTHGWLFALADGVGGHDRGEVASRVAVECMLEGFRKSARGESLNAVLPRLVQAANAKVFETGMATPTGSNMATTRSGVRAPLRSRDCVARRRFALLSGAPRLCGGGSRAIIPLRTSSFDGSGHGRRSGPVQCRMCSSRSLGNNMFLSVDTSENQIIPGDVLLLCSDGLHNSVNAEDIGRIAGHGAPLDLAARELVDLANQRDGNDNISVQLIRVRSVERVGMYRGRHYKLL
jgi:serine/threonine protein phosphatase PrpC